MSNELHLNIVFNSVKPYCWELFPILALPDGFGYRARFQAEFVSNCFPFFKEAQESPGQKRLCREATIEGVRYEIPTVADGSKQQFDLCPKSLSGAKGLLWFRNWSSGQMVPLRYIQITEVEQLAGAVYMRYLFRHLVNFSESDENLLNKQLNATEKLLKAWFWTGYVWVPPKRQDPREIGANGANLEIPNLLFPTFYDPLKQIDDDQALSVDKIQYHLHLSPRDEIRKAHQEQESYLLEAAERVRRWHATIQALELLNNGLGPDILLGQDFLLVSDIVTPEQRPADTCKDAYREDSRKRFQLEPDTRYQLRLLQRRLGSRSVAAGIANDPKASEDRPARFAIVETDERDIRIVLSPHQILSRWESLRFLITTSTPKDPRPSFIQITVSDGIDGAVRSTQKLLIDVTISPTEEDNRKEKKQRDSYRRASLFLILLVGLLVCIGYLSQNQALSDILGALISFCASFAVVLFYETQPKRQR